MVFTSIFPALGLLAVILIAFCLTKLAAFLHNRHVYWKKSGVPYVQGVPFYGSAWRLVLRLETFVDHLTSIYNSHPNARYVGAMDFSIPAILIRDPELVRELGVKYFEHFPDHRSVPNEEMDPIFGKNVFSLTGDRWKEMRNTLSPFFTSSKMKFMFGLVSKCSEDFFEYLYHHPDLCSMVDAKEFLRRFTNDVIATSAFGISVNSLKDRDNEFYKAGDHITKNVATFRFFKFLMFYLFPRFCRRLGFTFFSKSTMSFLQGVIADTVKAREEQGIVRPDMIHLLLEAKGKKLSKEMTIDDIVAQAAIFFLAGYDTVSSAMSFLTYELAVNPEIQRKLREEVDRYLAEENGGISYDALAKMEYMEMVISETLRMYPVVVIIDRVCAERFDLPSAAPGYKGVTVQPGTSVWYPSYAFHHDPKYFPEPEKFIPERFNEKNKTNIVPYTYIPFGVGPRMCIGNRFALMEVKIMMVSLLRRFVIVPNEKTKPLVFKKNSFQLIPVDGIWFTLKKRDL
nr:cytochrome P450 9e2-like [Nomia melanderi]